MIGPWSLAWSSEHLVPSLLHTLWQGVFVAVVLGIALALLPARRANLRYVLSLAALVAIVAGWLITWNVLQQSALTASQANQQEVRVAVGPPPARSVARIETDGHSALDPDAVARRLPFTSSNLDVSRAFSALAVGRWRPVLQAVWLLGVGLMTLRLIVSVVGAYREAGRALAGLGPTHELTRKLCERMGVRRAVRVAAVERLPMPAVIGVVWPTILLPVALLGETSSEQLRFILAHELAHIRRYDYLVNLAQLAVEALLFFNPAVWWISRRVRLEREACCDALAVEALGNPAGYARTLVDWAERERAHAPVALAFSSPRGQLRERVSRLLLGDHRPQLGVSPWSLLVLLLVGGAALAGLSRGTGLAVAVAAQIMSPAERIEKIAQAEQQYGEPPLKEGKLQISGTVKNADGGPIAKTIQLQNNVLRKSANTTSSTQKSMSCEGGKFTDTVNSGELWVWGQQPGYALSMIGPITVRASAPPEPLELVFNRGFSGQLLITDQQDQPVPNASVDASQFVEAGGFYIPVGKFTTDALGQGTLEHLDHLHVAPIKVNVVATGFQEIKSQKIEVVAERVTTLRLKPAAVSSGLVKYEADGQPAAGDRLVTLQINRRRANHNEAFTESKLLATADAEGRFTLDRLSDDFSYDLVVEGTDGSRAKLSEVRAGDTNLEAKLPKPIVVRGTVLHPEKLPKDGMLRYTSYRMISGQATVTVRDGVGHFEITGILPPDLTIWTPYGWGVPIDLKGPLDTIVIDLSRTSPPIQMRPVSVRLVPPEGMPAAQGSLQVGILAGGVPIQDGTASFQHPAGVASLSPSGLAGYWFPTEDVTVTAGLETLVHTIRLFPAGAVTGKVEWVNPIGPEPRVQLFDFGNSTQAGDAPRYQPKPRARAEGREFLISPMPLETAYGLLVIQGATTGIGPRMEVDSERPLLEVSVPRPEMSIDETGVVTDEDGRPLAGAIVRLEVSVVYQGASHVFSTNLTSTMTDMAGKFAFSGLTIDPRLSYSLIVEKSRYQPYYDLTHRPSSESLGIQLQAGHRLRLRLIDAQGQPARQVHVRMHPVGDENFEHTRYVWTDDQGNLETDTLSAGEIEVHVRDSSVRLESDGPSPIELQIDAAGGMRVSQPR